MNDGDKIRGTVEKNYWRICNLVSFTFFFVHLLFSSYGIWSIYQTDVQSVVCSGGKEHSFVRQSFIISLMPRTDIPCYNMQR